jgi:anti-anti-sigma factor
MDSASQRGSLDSKLVGGAVTRVTLRGEWDASNASEIVAAVTEAAESGCTAFALDLREVSFIDSHGLMALLTVQKQAHVSGWDVAFVKPADTHIWNLFELTALTTCLAFFDSPTAALIAVASSTDARPQ